MNFIKPFIHKIFSKKSPDAGSRRVSMANAPSSTAKIVHQNQHHINPKLISRNALKVLHRLKNAGFEAYLVGGAVRDLLLGHHPKDFDVATNATPEEVRSLFRNCRLIGRRFRLAHIHFGRDIIEVATFRGHHSKESDDGIRADHGIILRDNVYGNIEEDAQRRDFSFNALYYNIKDHSVEDYVGGFDDLKNKKLKLIGDPEVRYKEDPVRMLRAIRFAAKLDIEMTRDTEEAISHYKSHLEHIPPARLFEEIRKLFTGGQSVVVFDALLKHDLFSCLFPLSAEAIGQVKTKNFAYRFIHKTFANTDERLAKGKHITPAFFLAALLWPPIQERLKTETQKGIKPLVALPKVIEGVLSEQTQHVSIPRRFTITMRDIWMMQYRLPQRMGKKAFHLMEHPRFRAAYDFLLLRTQVGDKTKALADWWTDFIDATDEDKDAMIVALHESKRKTNRPKKAPKPRPEQPE